MSKFEAWFRFATRVWISLAAGWLAPVVAISPFLKLDQAGALLVCSALVAEVFHEKGHRLFVHQIQPGTSEVHIYREVDVSGQERKDIEITPHQIRSGRTTVNTASWPLYHLSRPDEFYREKDSRDWHLERTMKRVERRVDYSIIVTAIFGTSLWAFA